MSMDGITISCREIVETMTDYLEGRMSSDERIVFERHLVQCPPCREYLGQLRVTIREVGRLREVEPAIPAATRAALLSEFRNFRRAFGKGG